MTTADLIRQLVAIRYRHGITQTQVAQAIGVARSNIAKFETCQSNPRMSTILRYAHAVGAYINWEVA